MEGYFKALERKKYKVHIRLYLSRWRSPQVCSRCKGTRLREEARCVRLHGKTFQEYMKMTLGEMQSQFQKNLFSKQETFDLKDLLDKLKVRLESLNALGLSYLTLNRPVNSLSGGEFQRLNLSSRIGMGLSQMLYVLDEPTVGLHPRDTHRLTDALEKLKNLGNTIVVVEHDGSVIQKSDFIIEMGPKAGAGGGKILWSGLREHFKTAKNSNTWPYLRAKGAVLKTKKRPVNIQTFKYILSLTDCRGHNLKGISLKVPLNRFVVVTGVSGSGKSSLIQDTLFPALQAKLTGKSDSKALRHKSISGFHCLRNVTLLSQADLRQTLRSSPASYMGIYSLIRGIFAGLPKALKSGLTPSAFSVNVEGGRCEACKGLGFQEIDLVFMDPISVVCEECKGQKFQNKVLKVRQNGLNIYEMLCLTVEEASSVFKTHGALLRGLFALKEVGLAYLTLGQSLSSLSAGERQRLKLAREILESSQAGALYILDEPTKGLHFHEIRLLLNILQKLVDSGGSVLVVEHNLEIMKAADYIIDLGPEAGAGGGEIVAEGPPAVLAKSRRSHTARHLRPFLKR